MIRSPHSKATTFRTKPSDPAQGSGISRTSLTSVTGSDSPKEKAASCTCLRRCKTFSAIGIMKEAHRQAIAQPMRALKAFGQNGTKNQSASALRVYRWTRGLLPAVDPMYIKPSIAAMTDCAIRAFIGMPAEGCIFLSQLDPGMPPSRAKPYMKRDKQADEKIPLPKHPPSISRDSTMVAAELLVVR